MAMQDKTNSIFVEDAMAGVAVNRSGYNSATFVFSNVAEAEVKLQHSEDGITYTDVPGHQIIVPGVDMTLVSAPGVEVTGDTSGTVTYAANTADTGYNRLGYLGGLKYVKLVTTDILATAVCVLSDSIINPVGYTV